MITHLIKQKGILKFSILLIKISPTTAGVNEGRPLHSSSPIKLNSEDNYERNTDKRRCAGYAALS